MALLHRHLIIALFLALAPLAIAPRASAQPTPPANGTPSVFRAFCVSYDQSIEGLFYDLNGRQVPFGAHNRGLSAAYARPRNGVVALYRELPPSAPGEKPLRIPVAEFHLEPGGPWLVLLAVQRTPATGQAALQTRILNYSWKAHPARQIRLLNFSRNSLAMQAGDALLELPPGEDRLHPYPAADHLWLKIAAVVGGGWQPRLSAPQRILPGDNRATWVLLDRPVTPDNPEPRIVVRQLVEPAPAVGPL